MKLYYYYIKDIDIKYSKILNNPAENPIDKLANKKIHMLLNYLEPEKPH